VSLTDLLQILHKGWHGKKNYFCRKYSFPITVGVFLFILKDPKLDIFKKLHDGLLSVEKIKTIFQNFTKLVKSCKFKMAEKFNMADFLRKT
jgi:hypothetical protein